MKIHPIACIFFLVYGFLLYQAVVVLSGIGNSLGGGATANYGWDRGWKLEDAIPSLIVLYFASGAIAALARSRIVRVILCVLSHSGLIPIFLSNGTTYQDITEIFGLVAYAFTVPAIVWMYLVNEEKIPNPIILFTAFIAIVIGFFIRKKSWSLFVWLPCATLVLFLLKALFIDMPWNPGIFSEGGGSGGKIILFCFIWGGRIVAVLLSAVLWISFPRKSSILNPLSLLWVVLWVVFCTWYYFAHLKIEDVRVEVEILNKERSPYENETVEVSYRIMGNLWVNNSEKKFKVNTDGEGMIHLTIPRFSRFYIQIHSNLKKKNEHTYHANLILSVMPYGDSRFPAIVTVFDPVESFYAPESEYVSVVWNAEMDEVKCVLVFPHTFNPGDGG